MFIFFAIAFPLIELWFLIVFGASIGAFATVLWVVFSMLVGIAMMRSAGFLAFHRMMSAPPLQGDDSAVTLFESVLVFIGGLALIVPGFISDAFGFICLFSPTRTMMARFATRSARVHSSINAFSVRAPSSWQRPPQSRDDGKTIEGSWSEDNKNDDR